MLLSKSCIYGLRASLYLASQKEGEFIPIKIMSEKLDISFHFLTKILQKLTAEDLLESFKGPNGGIRLSKPASDVYLIDIVLALDGPALLTECALGLPGCGHKKPCPLHEKWADARDGIHIMLKQTSLKEMVNKGVAENLRLTADGGFDLIAAQA